MAFPISDCGGYGSGSTNLTATAAQIINSYAQITTISGNSITLGNISGSDFTVGSEILIHASAYIGTADQWDLRGKWFVATITAISGATLTLDKNLGNISLADCLWQAVSIPHYKNVTIKSGKSITCPQFTQATGYGGIVAFKCSGELKFNGGHIDLAGKGLADNSLFDKGLVHYEPHDSILRISAGWENHRAQDHLTINYPDGAAFIIAKKMTCHEDSRIGNPNLYGAARSTWIDSKNIIGGASILICAETIDDFEVKMIAKTGSASPADSRGRGRCYIATETCLPCDEGLYAYDRISDPTRLSRVFNIKSFGDGSDGEKNNLTTQINNYAAVTAIDKSRKVFTISGATTNGLSKFKEGALVMLHCTQNKSYECAGRFILAKIVGYSLNKMTLDTAAPDDFNVKNYSVQIISVPQFSTFTLSKANTATPAFENGRGGICAIAVSDTCNLSGGSLLPKGGAPAYGAAGLDFISNAQMAEKLPIGAGNGSIFILANNLIMNTSTRLGGSQNGNDLGGLARRVGGGDQPNNIYQRFEGGDYDADETQGLTPSKAPKSWHGGTTGGGKQAGTCSAQIYNGGFAANGLGTDDRAGGKQGAHILIVANKITGFNLSAMSTGGTGGKATGLTKSQGLAGYNGGCGYGGAGTSVVDFFGGNGGYIGGGGGAQKSSTIYGPGGGAGAFAFVYCNEAVNPDYSGVIID